MSHPRKYGHAGKPKCVNMCSGRVNLTCCCHQMCDSTEADHTIFVINRRLGISKNS